MIFAVGVSCFFIGWAARGVFARWGIRPGKPEVTEWGESTRFWSDVDWEWYERKGTSPPFWVRPDAEA